MLGLPIWPPKRSALVMGFALLLNGCASPGESGPAARIDLGGDGGLLGATGSRLTGGLPDRGSARNIAVARTSTPAGFADLAPESVGRNAANRNDPSATMGAAGSYNLNFVDVELQDFVRTAFEEVLHENVVVDAGLSGHVTVRTPEPVTRPVAQQLVMQAIQAAGATAVRNGSVWRVAASGTGGGRLREVVRVIPLQFIDAASATQALQPFGAGAGADVSVGGNGRFLIVAGKAAEVDAVQQVVTSLDIDELRGRSFVLIPLKQASAEAVTRDISQMIATSGAPQAKIIPLERMNAIMVVSRDPALAARIRRWVPRLDANGPDQRRVYVYPVRNRRASEIASVLEGMFAAKGRPDAAGATSAVAPGSGTDRVDVLASSGGDASRFGATTSKASTSPFGALSEAMAKPAQAPQASEGIAIRADVATNTLVVICKQNEYSLVQSAIRNLDVLPAQVLIEVTIAEVRLNQSLSHGVSWFFQAGHHGIGSGTTDASGGFTYTFGVPSAKVALEALESVTKVEIMAAPALTVLDNQTAMLKVGDQVPIQTRSSQSVATADAPVVSDITLKDTGIILKVTPRINASGLVLLDIDQEDSDVVPTTSSNINSPTIRQRQINSSVAVQSGSEIVLGGIITRQKERDQAGLPLLNDIPFLGKALATSAQDNDSRTELLIILRPTIMANQEEVTAVTQEIKQRMRNSEGQLR